MADDLAALLAEERYGPPPLRDLPRPLPPHVREPLMTVIGLLAGSLASYDAQRRARRRRAQRSAA